MLTPGDIIAKLRTLDPDPEMAFRMLCVEAGRCSVCMDKWDKDGHCDGCLRRLPAQVAAMAKAVREAIATNAKLLLDGCSCGEIGDTGAHRPGCQWGLSG